MQDYMIRLGNTDNIYIDNMNPFTVIFIFITYFVHRMRKMNQVTLMRGKTTVLVRTMSSGQNPWGEGWITSCTRPMKVSEAIKRRKDQGEVQFTTAVTHITLCNVTLGNENCSQTIKF